MRTLALDTAIETGWAVGHIDGDAPKLLESGVQVFEMGRGESPGMRFVRFRAWLHELGRLYQPQLVVYELTHHRGGYATELGVGLTTRVIEFAAELGVEHAGVHTGTLKKRTTGSGAAKKPEMIAAAVRRFGVPIIDDNHADALCLFGYAFDVYGGGKARAAG